MISVYFVQLLTVRNTDVARMSVCLFLATAPPVLCDLNKVSLQQLKQVRRTLGAVCCTRVQMKQTHNQVKEREMT